MLLARILKNGGNFLILDEPTNDLDLPTLRIVEEALIAFPGVVLVVSHDRYFLNRVCTGILAFEGEGRVESSVGDYDYYVEKGATKEIEKAHDRGRAIVVRVGQKHLGPPAPSVVSKLKKINDVDRLDRMVDTALTASSWREVLATR